MSLTQSNANNALPAGIDGIALLEACVAPPVFAWPEGIRPKYPAQLPAEEMAGSFLLFRTSPEKADDLLNGLLQSFLGLGWKLPVAIEALFAALGYLERLCIENPGALMLPVCRDIVLRTARLTAPQVKAPPESIAGENDAFYFGALGYERFRGDAWTEAFAPFRAFRQQHASWLLQLEDNTARMAPGNPGFAEFLHFLGSLFLYRIPAVYHCGIESPVLLASTFLAYQLPQAMKSFCSDR